MPTMELLLWSASCAVIAATLVRREWRVGLARRLLAAVYALLFLSLVPSLLDPRKVDRPGQDCETYGWQDAATLGARAFLALGSLVLAASLLRGRRKPSPWMWIIPPLGYLSSLVPWLLGSDGCTF